MNLLIGIGALIGLALGGWRGAVLGAAIAYLLGRALPGVLFNAASARIQAVQQQFLDSTFAVMGAMCKADGQVTPDEIRAAETLFDQLRLSADARASSIRAFNRGKTEDFDLDAEVARFAQAARGQRVLHQMFIQIQLSALAADGRVHPAEHALLLRIARGLGLSEQDLAGLEAMLRGERQQNASSSLDDAYRVLGVAASASDAEVKRAYRVLMSQNHPDKLAAKGLPDSMRAMAEQKTRQITGAYDRIERARRAAA